MTETPQQDRVNTEHLRDYSQLRRSVTDRKVAGVAGGLGRHLNVDPTILRVAFVVLAFFGGAGLLLYGVLWLFVPEEGRDKAVIATSAGSRNAIIVVAGVLAALLLLGDSWGHLGFPWPLAVVAIVVLLLLMNRDKSVSATYNPPPGPDSGVQPGAAPPSGPGTDAPTQPAPDAPPYTAPAPYSGAVPPATAPYPVQQPPAPRPDRGPKLFWFTVALLAVALGALGLYDVAVGSVVDSAYPALALAVIGVMLVVGAWFGRPGGLIALGVVATVALLATSASQPRWAGDRVVNETPTRATQVQSGYFVPAGSLHVDMSNIHDVARLDGRTIDVHANAGEIVVTLPEGVDADINADVSGAGEVTVLDETRNGVGNISVDRSVEGGPNAPHINLNVDIAVGDIEVRQ